MRELWNTDVLKNLLELIIDYRGKTPKKLGGDWQKDGIPAISAKNIKFGKIVRKDTIKYVSKEIYKKWMKDELKENDILLTSEAPLGEVLFLKGYSKYVLSQRLYALRTKSKIIYPRYLAYYLESNIGQKELDSRATGATVQGIRQTLLKEVNVNYPPLPTQRKIAGVLSAYDDLIENNTRRIAILEEMAQRIYKEWFVDFKYPGHENDTLVDSELGMIPEGWEVKKLGDVCKRVQAGGTPSRKNELYWNDGKINWYKTGELQDCFLLESGENITTDGLENSSAKMFDVGTILMAIYGSPTVGRIGILTKASSCNQAAIGFVADAEIITQSYLFYVLFGLRDYFNGIAMGAAQQNISKEKVVKAKAVVPNSELLTQFDDVVLPIQKEIKNLTIKNQTLRQTRDLLLPKLISGKVDVSELGIEN